MAGSADPPSPRAVASAGAASHRWPDALGVVAIGLLAGFVMLARLGAVYLWQDEASTALLGERMMRYGKPLAYDGKNLLTMDHRDLSPEGQEAISRASLSAEAGVAYLASLGEFKPDTTWIGQPWGPFVLAGLSLELLGHGTWQARLPFALAGVITCVLLYAFVRRQLESRTAAWLAALLLIFNTFWVLHGRQCRYYSTSSLLLLLTLMAFLRWQTRGGWAAALFAISGWCWFQCDYGSFWPAMGVLFVAAVWAEPRRLHEALAVFAALGLSIAPFVWYYEIFGRLQASSEPWREKLFQILFNLNQYILPLPIVVLAVALLALRYKRHASVPRIVPISLAILLVMPIWVSSVAPAAFHRYLVNLTPLGALVAAWSIVQLLELSRFLREHPVPRTLAACALAAALAFTTLASRPGAALVPERAHVPGSLESLLRPELRILEAELFRERADPNRLAIEWVEAHTQPGDEIVVNYEDIPFMFYTEHPVRGGTASFRLSDPDPPALFLLRRSVSFVYWPLYERELGRYAWQFQEIPAPDVPWGNVPDPRLHPAGRAASAPPMLGGIRVPEAPRDPRP